MIYILLILQNFTEIKTILVIGPSQSKEILKELETLEKWSKNIDIVDDFLRQHSQDCPTSSLIEHFKKLQNNILIFLPSQIKYKPSVFRSSFPNPLELSSGYFQNTQITLRGTIPGLFDVSHFAEAACKKDFEVLS